MRSEEDRSRYIKEIMVLLRKSANVIGCSWWSFNDYYSRYAGSNKDGFRPWGLVDYTFSPRDAYWAQQAELSPVTIIKKNYLGNSLIIELSARADFPSYTVRGYKLRYSGGEIDVPALKPGQRQELSLRINGNPDNETIALLKPTGFEVFHTIIQLK